MNRRRVPWIAPPLAVALAASAVMALAYWTAPGSGMAIASSASLAEATISVPGTSPAMVTVTWTQQALLQPTSPDSSSITYSVERRLGAGAWAALASGGCSGAMPHGTTSCADTLPAPGTYSYRVVASYATWTAISGTTSTTAVDVTGPTGGSVDATELVGTGGRYSTSTALSIAFMKGTDPSGLAPTGAKLRRATATLTSSGTANGSCGSYGAFVQIGADDPTSPAAHTVPSGQACYRYEYVVQDTLGNSTTYTSPDIKVDTTAPAAGTFAFSGLTNAYGTGSTIYFRRSAPSGAFTVTATATEPTSGIASYAFPNIPSPWTVTPGATGVTTYSWSSPNPPASGAQAVTATNHATLTGPAGTFTMVNDSTAPAGGNVTFTSGYYTSTSVPVSFAAGTDGGSGINATSGLLQRAEATLTPSTGACGAYGAFATITGGTNPTSPFSDTSVVDGRCYQYRYLIFDNVGNQATYTTASVARVDTTPASPPTAVSVTSGGNLKPAPVLCSIAVGTRYINNAGKAAVGVSATIPPPETGESVVFSATTPGSIPVTLTVAAGGTTVTGTINLTSLLDGTVTLTARTRDAAGNLSPTVSPANVVIKDVVAGALSGLSYNDRVSPLVDQILGTSECGATIVAVKSGGATYASTPLAAAGSFTLDVQAQAALAYSYDVTATDLAGNTSAIIVVSGSAFL